MPRFPADGECRDAECRSPIIWTVSAARHKPMPVNPEPVPDGNLLLTAMGDHIRAEVVDPNALPMGADPAELYVAHFRTCPGAAHWRNR